MDERLRTGYRRAVPTPPILVLDAEERARVLQAATADPQQQWRLEEFDGSVFVPQEQVRGPEARARFLAGGRGPAAQHAAEEPAPGQTGQPRSS